MTDSTSFKRKSDEETKWIKSIRQKFTRMDADSNGKVTQDEIRKLLIFDGVTKEEAAHLASDFMLQSDANEDETLDFSEYVQEHLRQAVYAALREVRSMDQYNSQNGQYRITKARLLAALSNQVGSEEAALQIDKLFEALDTDKSGHISMQELMQCYFERTKKIRLNRIQSKRKSCLLIIDVQYDFLPPKGSLAVTNGDQIIPVINKLRSDHKWDLIALTQDWHDPKHVSYYETHKENKEAKLFGPLKLKNGTIQMMWPVHCVQNSEGAKFHKDLVMTKNDAVVQKGTHIDVDSYSGFYDNDHKTQTELKSILLKENITDVYCVGLAYDYCVGYSALDSQAAGFNTFVIEDACRGVAPESIAAMKKNLHEAKVHIISSKQVVTSLGSLTK